MKRKRYIFFFLTLLIFTKTAYANNSYIILNNNSIEDIEKKLQTNDNITINLNINKDELIAKRKILDLIKDTNKTITYNVLNNSELIYSYKFNGKNFNKSYNDINLEVKFSIEQINSINEIFNTNSKIIVNTQYKGNYPTGTILSIKNTKNLKKTNLYIIDNKNNIKKLNNEITNTNNFINIDIKKGDTYIVTNKELVKMDTIKIYIGITILLLLEIIILFIISFLKQDIDLPKLKKSL